MVYAVFAWCIFKLVQILLIWWSTWKEVYANDGLCSMTVVLMAWASRSSWRRASTKVPLWWSSKQKMVIAPCCRCFLTLPFFLAQVIHTWNTEHTIPGSVFGGITDSSWEKPQAQFYGTGIHFHICVAPFLFSLTSLDSFIALAVCSSSTLVSFGFVRSPFLVKVYFSSRGSEIRHTARCMVFSIEPKLQVYTTEGVNNNYMYLNFGAVLFLQMDTRSHSQ